MNAARSMFILFLVSALWFSLALPVSARKAATAQRSAVYQCYRQPASPYVLTASSPLLACTLMSKTPGEDGKPVPVTIPMDRLTCDYMEGANRYVLGPNQLARPMPASDGSGAPLICHAREA